MVDKNGNVYFADIDHHVIRKVDNNGIITTIAGSGTAGYTGDGGLATLATLNQPFGLALNNDGQLFIADAYNHVVRKVDATGVITTIIGDGSPGFSGEGGLAKNAKLNFPAGLAFDNMNHLFIADYGNARIRKVTLGTLPVTLTNFSAILNNNKVKIDWETAAEANIAYFNVQRSNEGSRFTTIGKVAAVGNSSTKNDYQFVDEETKDLSSTVLYYRLQSMDKDGSSTYSKIVGVKLNHINSITLYPNPVNDVLNVIISSNKKETTAIQITDFQGKVVKQLNIQLNIGFNGFNIDVATLAKGSYAIKFTGATLQYKYFVKL